MWSLPHVGKQQRLSDNLIFCLSLQWHINTPLIVVVFSRTPREACSHSPGNSGKTRLILDTPLAVLSIAPTYLPFLMSVDDLSFADSTTVISVITKRHSRPHTKTLPTHKTVYKFLAWIQQSVVIFKTCSSFFAEVQECGDLKAERLLEGSSRWIRTVCWVTPGN